MLRLDAVAVRPARRARRGAAECANSSRQALERTAPSQSSCLGGRGRGCRSLVRPGSAAAGAKARASATRCNCRRTLRGLRPPRRETERLQQPLNQHGIVLPTKAAQRTFPATDRCAAGGRRTRNRASRPSRAREGSAARARRAVEQHLAASARRPQAVQQRRLADTRSPARDASPRSRCSATSRKTGVSARPWRARGSAHVRSVCFGTVRTEEAACCRVDGWP